MEKSLQLPVNYVKLEQKEMMHLEGGRWRSGNVSWNNGNGGVSWGNNEVNVQWGSGNLTLQWGNRTRPVG